jgi:hypothetical protein
MLGQTIQVFSIASVTKKKKDFLNIDTRQLLFREPGQRRNTTVMDMDMSLLQVRPSMARGSHFNPSLIFVGKARGPLLG